MAEVMTPTDAISTRATKFLVGSGADGAAAQRAPIEDVALGQLLAIDTSKLQTVIAFLTESVGAIADTVAKNKAEGLALHDTLHEKLAGVRAAQDEMGAQLVETAAKVASHDTAVAALSSGDGETPPALATQLQEISESTAVLKAEQGALRKEFDDLRGWAESVEGNTKAFEDTLATTKAEAKKGDEAERRALQAEIARVEMEIAKLAAMRAEDEAERKREKKAEKRKVKEKKPKVEAGGSAEKPEEEEIEEEQPDFNRFLEGVWNTSLGQTQGVILVVKDDKGNYGNFDPQDRLYEIEYADPNDEGLFTKVSGRWGSATGAPGVPRSGVFSFTVSADRHSFTGVYSDGGPNESSWKGSRASEEQIAAIAAEQEAKAKAMAEKEKEAAEAAAAAEAEAAAEAAAAAAEAEAAAKAQSEPEPEPKPVTPLIVADGATSPMSIPSMHSNANSPISPSKPSGTDDEHAAATSTLLAEMTKIRLEVAETEKVFATKLREHAEVLDGQFQSLGAKVDGDIAGVSEVRESLVTIKDAMSDKVDSAAISKLEALIAEQTKQAAAGAAAAAAAAVPDAPPLAAAPQALPELQSMLSALDDLKSNVDNKADKDLLHKLEMQLMDQVHKMVESSAQQVAAAPAPIDSGASPEERAAAEEQARVTEQLLNDLATLREELLVTQAKLGEAEHKAIEHATETARMFFNAKSSEMDSQLKAIKDAAEAHAAQLALEQANAGAPPDPNASTVANEEANEALRAYCLDLFHQLEQKINSQTAATPEAKAEALPELKIFKRTWWEAIQANVNQKASLRDMRALQHQMAQVQASLAGSSSISKQQQPELYKSAASSFAVNSASAAAAASGTGRFINNAYGHNSVGPTDASSPSAQVHIVVGDFPSKQNTRLSRSLGGGAVALRADDEIVFLQNRLEEKLQVLKTMYDNKGWGIRGHSVLSTASALSTLRDPVDQQPGQASMLPLPGHTLPGVAERSLWSRNSHQRAMLQMSAGGSPPPSKVYGGSTHELRGVPRQLYPMDGTSPSLVTISPELFSSPGMPGSRMKRSSPKAMAMSKRRGVTNRG
eukprot:COSAG05_NODE_878_length_6804_cov_4.974944_5_plen_1066_part_00